jgi:hypothetical protein
VNIFIEDADIWFKRNKFPKVEDEGKIRISIGGSGVRFSLPSSSPLLVMTAPTISLLILFLIRLT